MVAFPQPPPVSAELFGGRLPLAARYVELLVTSGVERGLLGPRESARIWQRHVLNSVVVGELIPSACRVVDVGSGAGLPGIPLAIARPDLSIALLEPMARRVEWLAEVLAELGLAVEVVRGRAEERPIRAQLRGADAVTARAVAPLGRLAGWALPLLHPGGRLLAIKGESAARELECERAAVQAAGGVNPRIVRCGVGVLDPPATVVVVAPAAADRPRSRSRKDRRS